ncbi:MAG: class II D-tagatose-bisphosphate aldolase, non-catalytic subunit [Desulfobacteraceae bacterium]|nr:class II D-tagatose-bisphosphate aldolase, non-catalytic subunit [Desulfobacteraceae bacterium]
MKNRQTPRNYLESIGPCQRRGETAGIYSICSSHRIVLEAAFAQAKEDKSPLLVEATCNQVNQFGGYSGMTPADFAEYVFSMARRMNFDQKRLMIGGDHLGPYVWRKEPAEKAMEKAQTMVSDCVRAGYSKIHLDASMPLGDDEDEIISNEISAKRAARLCNAAERTAEQIQQQDAYPLYVIGAEVPTPGGSTATEKDVPVSDPQEVSRFIEICKNEFSRNGLDNAWNRVIAVVVQPGIDFGETWVAHFNREAATRLSDLHDRLPGAMTYEIHATDFQTPQALEKMTQDHFALMKIGPCLTHSFREAVFALAHIEELWLAGRKSADLSGIKEELCRIMNADPGYWKSHHSAKSASDWTVLFSYLDRVRYYWNRLEVEDALARLFANLSGQIPQPLLSQYLPAQYRAVAEGIIPNDPASLIHHKIRDTLFPYASACRMAQNRE